MPGFINTFSSFSQSLFTDERLNREEKFYIPPVWLLILIVILAIATRIIFFTGLTFSDDGYYDQLGYMMLKGENITNILGYPIFLLRRLDILLTAISFTLFGTNEIASVIPVFLFSIGNIVIVYFTGLELSLKKSTALMASLLLCFFPVDVFFATVHFTDLPASFFINIGIFLLLKSYRINRIAQAIYGGIFLTLALFLKESVLYILILMFFIWIWFLIIKRKNIIQIPIAFMIFACGISFESIYYYFTQGDFFYRFSMQYKNYLYCPYDFFPYTKDVNSIPCSVYFKKLVKYILGENTRYIFFRRFYLFTPLIAGVQSFILWKKGKNTKLLIWFAGIIILAAGFTVSFSAWRPSEMKKSWYIYIYLEPTILMAALFVDSLRNKYRIAAVTIYIIGCVFMVNSYSAFFGMKDNNEIKKVILNNNSKVIYTDHFDKYNLDVVLKYKDTNQIRIFTGRNFDPGIIKPGEWVFIDDKAISELKQQGYEFTDFSFVNSKHFNLVFYNNTVKIYEKVPL
jgi:4-amino-4-deoxy-L-arabinose transferase-like glycosyltransferase